MSNHEAISLQGDAGCHFLIVRMQDNDSTYCIHCLAGSLHAQFTQFQHFCGLLQEYMLFGTAVNEFEGILEALSSGHDHRLAYLRGCRHPS